MSFPISYQADKPERRNRLTVFFRLLTAIPGILVGIVWGIAAAVCVLIAWFAILFTGRWPQGLYTFTRGATQYFTRLNAYIYLLTDDFPPFDTGDHPEYPVRLLIPEDAGPQNRLTVLFRIILYIPVYIINYVLTIVAYLCAFVMWFAALFTGRSPDALHNGLVFTLGYSARASAYALLLTDKWPPITDEGPAAVSAGASYGSLSSPPPPPPPPVAGRDEPVVAPPPPGVPDAPAPPPPPPPLPDVPDAPPPPPPPPAADDEPPSGGPFGPTT